MRDTKWPRTNTWTKYSHGITWFKEGERNLERGKWTGVSWRLKATVTLAEWPSHQYFWLMCAQLKIKGMTSDSNWPPRMQGNITDRWNKTLYKQCLVNQYHDSRYPCWTQLEFLVVKCWPHYLPQKFTAIIVVAVYIAPSANANAKEVLQELHNTISEQQPAHTDACFICQHINFATRRDHIPDLFYTKIWDSHKAIPPPLIRTKKDHLSGLLLPTYRPLMKLSRPVGPSESGQKEPL